MAFPVDTNPDTGKLLQRLPGRDPAIEPKVANLTAPAPHVNLAARYFGPKAKLDWGNGQYWNTEPVALPEDFQLQRINQMMATESHAKAEGAYHDRSPVPPITPIRDSRYYKNNGALVTFYDKKDQLWVRCQPDPMDKNTVIDRPANQSDISRWYLEYRQYESATE